MISVTWYRSREDYGSCINPFPKQQILDSSKLKEFADDNFIFDENGGKYSKIVKKHCEKRRNCSLRNWRKMITGFFFPEYHKHCQTVQIKDRIAPYVLLGLGSTVCKNNSLT